jgi:hypothetical protein
MSTPTPDRFVVLVWWFDNWQVGGSGPDAGEMVWKATESGLASFPTMVVDTLDRQVILTRLG